MLTSSGRYSSLTEFSFSLHCFYRFYSFEEIEQIGYLHFNILCLAIIMVPDLKTWFICVFFPIIHGSFPLISIRVYSIVNFTMSSFRVLCFILQP
jgi:hypothetical protein